MSYGCPCASRASPVVQDEGEAGLDVAVEREMDRVGRRRIVVLDSTIVSRWECGRLAACQKAVRSDFWISGR